MWAKQKGFTIVELLIVIVVIAILAAITIVAINGIQSKARDTAKYADAKAIIKALELYKVKNGAYPLMSGTNVTGTAICGSHNNGYSYSDATDNTWLRDLVADGIVSKVPAAPGNNCTSFYRYLSPGATNYNCPSRTVNYYVLEVFGVENSPTPADASDPAGGGNWIPCISATAGWGAGASTWVFAKDDN